MNKNAKLTAVMAALLSVGATMQKLNDNYGHLNSQDADFKNLKQEVDSALAMPADEAPPDDAAAVAGAVGIMTAMNERLDGFEDVLGHILANTPAPETLAQLTAHVDGLITGMAAMVAAVEEVTAAPATPAA
jgi:hypothetical protein